MSRVLTHTTAKGNLHIGDIEKGVFYKKVRKSRHLFKRGDSWGIDARKFKELILRNAQYICIQEQEERIDYVTTPQMYDKFGNYLHFKTHGSQIFLPRIYFKRMRNKELIEDWAPVCERVHNGKKIIEKKPKGKKLSTPKTPPQQSLF